MKVESDQAYINGTITSRAQPIAGQLQLEPLEPGRPVSAGATLFRVENLRFGNLEAMSQLNWIRELVDRLTRGSRRCQSALLEAAVIFKHFEALFKDKLTRASRVHRGGIKSGTVPGRSEPEKRSASFDRSSVARSRTHLALQRQAAVTMPFDGVVWAVRVQNGAEIGAHETVLHLMDPARLWVDAFVHEKHVDKFQVGIPVIVRTVDGKESWKGQVESVRAGVGRLDPESCVAVPPGELSRRRVAVRVRLDTAPPFTACQFFGVGRSVVVSLPERQ